MQYDVVAFLDSLFRDSDRRLQAERPVPPDSRPECARGEKSPLARKDDDDRETCRIIEHDLGVTPESLTLWELIRPKASSDRFNASRPLWVLLSNGMPIPVLSLDRAPDGATFWCQEADSAWRPLKH